jgi:hypothetical protein
MSPLTLSTPCVLRRLLRQDYPDGATGSPLSRQKIRAVTCVFALNSGGRCGLPQ